jgi:CARDB
MRRWLLTAVIVLGGSTIGAQLALGATAQSTTPHANLQAFVCRRAVQASKRVVSVTAVMRPVTGTARLRMRFSLTSYAGGEVTQIHGGDLGTWISPHPITLGQDPNDVWIVRHPVNGVAVPADYRFHVSFRWIGADHKTISSTTRSSALCRQPDMRPDLLVQSIHVDAVPGNANENKYVALIANDGLTAAKSFEVEFTPGDGGASQTVTIAKLVAHSTRDETFIGPACTSASDPTITVDPDHRVNELDPSDTSLTATCPTPSTPSPTSSERSTHPS